MATSRAEDEGDVVSSLEMTVKTSLSITDTKCETSCSISTATNDSGDSSVKNVTSDDEDNKTLHTTSTTNETSMSSSLNDQVNAADTQQHSESRSVFSTAVKSVSEKIQVYLADPKSVKLKKHTAPAILQDLRILVSCVDGLDEHSAKELFSILTEKATIMKNLYAFLLHMFEALRQEVDPCHTESLFMVLGLVEMLTGHSDQFCHYIVQYGLMMEHIDELCKMRSTSTNQQLVKMLIGVNLGIIHNCACSTDISDYFRAPEFDCVPIFKPFANSSDFSIRLHAVFILGFLSALLSQKEIDELLKLPIADMTCFITALQNSTTSNSHEVKVSDSVFSVPVALLSLENLLVNFEVCSILMKIDIVPSMLTLLACGSKFEQRACCQFLWSILVSQKFIPEFKNEILSSDHHIEECLASLLESGDTSLVPLTSSLLFLIESNGTEGDIEKTVKYAENCFRYCHFEECVRASTKIINSDREHGQSYTARYLLGKSKFHIYQRLKFQLKRMKHLQLKYTQEYQLLHKECYDLAKSAIDLLGQALDKAVLDPLQDFNGLRALDLLLMDYVAEEGKDAGRCFLCLQKRKLRKSHYFPKSLLDEFAKGAVAPDDRKIFKSSSGSADHGVSKSSRQMVLSLFCDSCEGHLARFGETQFKPQFFRKIYDETDPTRYTIKQKIHYKEWLYQFCVGIVFRGIIINYGDICINSSQLYLLLQKCRQIIYSFSPKSFPFYSPELLDKLQVALFINPSEARPDDHQYPCMVKVLNTVLEYMHLQCPLSSDVLSRPHRVHCFMIHFGMINIVVPVERSEFADVPTDNFISPKEGVFLVPADKERADKLPLGIWKNFQCLAMASEGEILVEAERDVQAFEAKKLNEPNEAMKKTFRFFESSQKAFAAFAEQVLKLSEGSSDTTTATTPTTTSGEVRRFDFLPDQFVVQPPTSPSSVHLPQDHTILIHRNYFSDDAKKSGITLFLAVGEKAPYSLQKPYLIYHHYENNISITVGFFVSPMNLSAEEFLPDLWTKELKEKLEWNVIESIRKVCHEMLIETLQIKGILNCPSLLKRVQSHKQEHMQSDLPNYDVKCEEPCWYCKDLCEVCLKPSSFGFTIRKDNNAVLKFCSQSCQLFGKYDSPPLVFEVWPPSESLPGSQFRSRRIENTHKELLYLHIQGKLSSGQHCMINMVFAVGDGSIHYPKDKVYIVYYLRTLEEQQSMEFFVGDDLHPEEAMAYAASKDADEAIARRRSTSEIKNLILMALVARRLNSLEDLIKSAV